MRTCPDEASAKRAFAAIVAEAIKDGWKQVPVGLGQRTLTLKPVPKPKKRA